MRFSCTLCTSTNSSKVKTILLPVKFLVESPGLAFCNCGGRESLGPPCGGITLAQPGPLITLIIMIEITPVNDIRPL